MSPQKLMQAFLHHGFKYIKVELEAQVNPRDYDDSYPCTQCHEGRVDCPDCDNTGVLRRECHECSGDVEQSDEVGATCEFCQGEDMIEAECRSCEGRGYYACEDCDGGTVQDDAWQDRYCEDFEHRFKENLQDIAGCFKYFRVYNDGSVDTECTLTLRVDHIEKLPAILSIFKDTCVSFGECETRNAGLHITLLEGYHYPRDKKLPAEKVENFKKHVSKLLLGLLYLGSVGDITRSFHCRELRISEKDKYSAIYTHLDTCLEFRLFDTCYDHPGQIMQYLSLIVKTLRYYTDKPVKYVSIGDSLTLERSSKILKKHHHNGYRELSEIFNSRESRIRLFAELPYLLNDKARRLLADVARLNPSQMCQEMFTVVKLFQ